MRFVLLLLALPISLADFRSLIIPNVYLKIFVLLIMPFLVVNGFGSLSRLTFLLAFLVLCHLFGLGMGDVKLLALIFTALNTEVSTDFTLFTLMVGVVALIHICFVAVYRGWIPSRIPLAPSIFVGLTLYLAT